MGKHDHAGVGNHNYCRNPLGGITIWCYTTDDAQRWEYCDPLNAPTKPEPKQAVEALSGANDAGYRGF